MIRTLLAGALAGFGFFALTEQASAQFTLNPEFVVNQTTEGAQTTTYATLHSPNTIAELTNGHRIIYYTDFNSWRTRVVTLDTEDIMLNEIDISIRINLGGVAALTTGGFVATWTDGRCVARIFNNSSIETRAEFALNTTVGYVDVCDVAPLVGGGFVAAWDAADVAGTDNIYAQRFDSAGNPLGPLITVSATAAEENFPTVDTLPSGGFVVTWLDQGGTDGDGMGTYLRAYDAFGAETTNSATLINGQTALNQRNQSAIGLSNGMIAAAYYDDSAAAVRVRIFHPDGTVAVPDFSVGSSLHLPDISPLPSGGFLLTASDDSGPPPDNSGYAIRLLEIANNGTILNSEVINQTTAGNQLYSRVGVFDDGSFLVTYTDYDNAVDGSNSSVLARSAPSPSDALLVALDAGSDFLNQTVASEVGAALSGDVIIDFGLADAFSAMGAGGVVEVAFTLTNATFSGPVPAAAWTAAADADCDFGQPSFGGGAGGNLVRFENTGQLNQCSGFGANDGFLTLPIEVTSNGDPVSLNVTFTPTADSGVYTGSEDDIDLLQFAQGLSFDITLGAAGAGLFDADGDELDAGASGILGTIGAALAAVDVDAAGTALANADDIAASGTLLIEFPDGATGIGSVDAGFGACTQGVAPNDNQFSCALTGANLNTIEGADQNITITDDGDNGNAVTAQTPVAALTLVGQADMTPVGTNGDLQVIELDDGLDNAVLANSNFDWVRFGSGGTESNFRIQLDSEAAAQRVTAVRVEINDGNGVAAPASPAYFTIPAGAVGAGFQQRGATITFNSGALGAAAGATGNADITGITLVYTEGTPPAPLGGAQALRQLVNRTPGSFVATPGLTNDN